MKIGKYAVLEHIATGGMGAIYRAMDVELERPVALKVLSPELAANPVAVERFRREAKSAAQLRHENIVAIYDNDQDNGLYFLVLEYVDGVDLQEYVAGKGTLDPEEARQILIQAARALEHAHKRGVVHRDVKPSNFLIAKKNDKLQVKLTDLGLARLVRDSQFRLTTEGTTVGTVDYMSPEQARDSSSCDIRSDIYSLGCTLFHMLTGAGPFPQGSLIERIQKHAESPPPDIRAMNPQVSEGLALILAKMLEKEPNDRYQTPRELLDDLENPDKLHLRVNKTEALSQLAQLAKEEPPAAALVAGRERVAVSSPPAAKKVPPPSAPAKTKPVPAKSRRKPAPAAPVKNPVTPPHGQRFRGESDEPEPVEPGPLAAWPRLERGWKWLRDHYGSRRGLLENWPSLAAALALFLGIVCIVMGFWLWR